MYLATSQTATTIVAAAFFALMVLFGAIGLFSALSFVGWVRRNRKIDSLDNDFERVLVELVQRHRPWSVPERDFSDSATRISLSHINGGARSGRAGGDRRGLSRRSSRRCVTG